MRPTQFLCIVLLALGAAQAIAAEPAPPPAATRLIPFIQMGSQPVISLRATDDTVLNFGSRGDELVTKAVLRLRYQYSPALLPGLSHVQVLLNDEVVGLLPVVQDGAAPMRELALPIDPRLITDNNRLGFHLVAHYAADNEDQDHSSLWVKLSGTSALELGAQPLPLPSDLAALPLPFFDKGDPRRLVLPFVFGAQPSGETLRASAVVASWFGQLASWRGARFPVYQRGLPTSHAIAFVTNRERPPFLAKMDPITGPGLRVIGSPDSPYAKILLVLGRDGRDLNIAAQALVLGSAALSGSAASVRGTLAYSAREAYDAPNWVRMDRPMQFGELVEYPQQLLSDGHALDPVRLRLRVPPDLLLDEAGVPLELRFRHTPAAPLARAQLHVGLNDQPLRVVGLRGGEDGAVPLDGGAAGAQVGGSASLLLPPFALRGRNELQFSFDFAARQGQAGQAARAHQAERWNGAIDANSRVDFSGHFHYLQMPSLGAFATLGFPFTKYADLSQTVVVLPHPPSQSDLEVMLALMGRMGESTGYPATGVRLATPDDFGELHGADLLLIGAAPEQALLKRWNASLPVAIDGAARRVSTPARAANFLYDGIGHDSAYEPVVIATQQVDSSAPIAALIGFESPLTAHRSVVALTAVSAEDMAGVLDALDDPLRLRQIQGSAALFRGQRIDSMLVGPRYVVGELPWWRTLWLRATRHPVMLAQAAVLLLLVLGFAYWRGRRAGAAARREP